MKPIINGTLWVGLLLLGLGPATIAYSHGGATGIVKERMETMKTLKEASKGIGEMIKGRQPFNAARVAEHARTIHDHSGEIPGQFPEGSLHDPSEALSAIWEDWSRFEAVTRQLQTESARLIEVAAELGDRRSVGRQFAQVGKACKSCHEDFRLKKEQ